MESSKKIILSAICAVLMPAAFFVSNSCATVLSTASAETELDAAEVMSQDLGDTANKEIQDYFYDGNEKGGIRDGGAVYAGDNAGSAAGANVTQNAVQSVSATAANPLNGKVPPLAGTEKLSTKPGVKQKNLGDLTSSPDGNLYKVVKESPWWKFWDSSRSIQKAVPDSDGYSWNEQGEYVGAWKTVLKTKVAGNLQVVKGADGNDHFYTQKGGWGTREVYRDAKYATTLSSLKNASLREIKAGADDNIYARYAKNAEDIIMKIDPVTKEQKVVARVPAEVHIWRDSHTRMVNDGNGHSHVQIYWETHTERNGVDKFDITGDGRVLTLYKGNVFEEGPDGDRKRLSGGKGRWSSHDDPLKDVLRCDVNDFHM
ncbi:MAG: hypothetical protein ABIG11_06745, partial [bacterium]